MKANKMEEQNQIKKVSKLKKIIFATCLLLFLFTFSVEALATDDSALNYSVDGTFYATLQDAYTAIKANGTTGTIVVEKDNIDSSNFIIESEMTITLNTNNHIITKTVNKITNNGQLHIEGNGTIQTKKASECEFEALIENFGELTIDGGNFFAHKGVAVLNEGNLLIGLADTGNSKTPSIWGATYAVETKEYSEINFFGGVLRGKLGAFNGPIRVAAGYQIFEYPGFDEMESGYQVAILGIGDFRLAETQIENQLYTGRPIEPRIEIKGVDDTVLEENVDYTLTYVNNVNPGTATILVKGIGDFYNGRYDSITFEIERADVKNFITEWTIPVNADGTADGGTTIKLPIPTNVSNNYTVDYGDGTVQSYTTEAFPTHKYTNTVETTYTIKITGTVREFGYNESVVPTATNSSADYYTFTQYLTKLVQWGEVRALRYGFSNCTKMQGEIPMSSENSFAEVTNFGYAFANCNLITGSIPSDLLVNAPLVTSTSGMFWKCTGLTGEIPPDLLKNTTKIKVVGSMFYGCTNLTGAIPENLFANLPELSSCNGVFQYCSNLTGSIPADLFLNNPNITDFRWTFSNCSKLTGEIPATLFSNATKAIKFYKTFEKCSSLTGTVPQELFANVGTITMPTNIDDTSGPFAYTFAGCTGLTVARIDTIYIGYKMFEGCNYLTKITIGDNVQAIATDAFKATSPYTESNLLPTMLITNNMIASLYNWNANNRNILIAPNVFVTEWTVPASTTIKLPIPTNVSNNYTVDYGDGTIQNYTTEAFPTHTYTNTAETTYTIKITGTVKTFGYVAGEVPTTSNSSSDYYTFTQYVTRLVQWGELNAERYGFSNCINLAGNIPEPTENSFNKARDMGNLFFACSKLTGNIPENLFANCPDLISLGSVFSNCSGLVGSIPENLFTNCPNITYLGGAFSDCTGLTGNIPANLFATCPKARIFGVTFGNCSGLTGSIPESLFANCSEATDFGATFNNCSGLTGSIPANLFANCSNAATFVITFKDCSNLTGSIPANLFANCSNVTTFATTFSNCSGLTGNIPESLFTNCSKVTNFSGTFNNCSGLTGSIPENLFANCPDVTTFETTFNRCVGLEGSIPENLFANCPNVTTFSLTFSDCTNLTGNIPANLFANCSNVTNFCATFNNCNKLTGSIPANLFANCPNVTNFSTTFNCCRGLTGSIPVELFANNTAITVPTDINDVNSPFVNTFASCTGLTSANVNTLYIGYQMFYGCNNLTDVTIGDNVQAIATNAFKATSPYSATDLLTTNLLTNNHIATDYDWASDNRTVRNPSLNESSLIMVWNIPLDADGTAGAGSTIRLPIPVHTQNAYMVNWGDGTVEELKTENYPTHTYTNTAETEYTIAITGKVHTFGYTGNMIPTSTNAYKDYYSFVTYLMSISQWGNIEAHRFGFSQCTNLQGPLPEATGFANLETVENMFADCTLLSGNIPQDFLAEATQITSAKNLFKNCVNIEGSLPNNLFSANTKIENVSGAFKEMRKLTGAIPENLFANLANVTSFSETFSGCKKLTGSIPQTLFTNNHQAKNFYRTFSNCTGITGTITNALFENIPITRVEFGANMYNDYRGMFENCSGLSEITVSLAGIGREMFKNCTGLRTIHLDKTVWIAPQAFYGCNQLTQIDTTKDYLAQIGEEAFYYTGTSPVKLLTNVNKQDEVLRAYVWDSDCRLVDVDAPKGTVTIQADKYPFTKEQQVTLQITVTDNYSLAENCQIAILNEDSYNDGVTLDELGWQPYQEEILWNLSANDGGKTVYVFFQDEFGNVSNESVIVDVARP